MYFFKLQCTLLYGYPFCQNSTYHDLCVVLHVRGDWMQFVLLHSYMLGYSLLLKIAFSIGQINENCFCSLLFITCFKSYCC